MTLGYDFDTCPAPDGMGPAVPYPDGRIALFRDPATAAALRGAAAPVRAYFEASGFGPGVSAVRLVSGTYAAADADHRRTVIERLTLNLRRHDLAGAEMNGLDFADLLEALERARAVETRPAPSRDPEIGAMAVTAGRFAGALAVWGGVFALVG